MNSNSSRLNRRSALKGVSSAVALGALATLPKLSRAKEDPALYSTRNNRINQSVIHWCFKPMSVEELAGHAARMGLKSVELVGPEYWPTLKKLGLICAISPSHGFDKGFARKESHAECLEILRKSIDASAQAGFPNVITFSGFRRGISDDEGLKNMVAGLKQVVGQAEKKK